MCPFHAAFWHSAPQYEACLQREQRLSALQCFPHCEQLIARYDPSHKKTPTYRQDSDEDQNLKDLKDLGGNPYTTTKGPHSKPKGPWGKPLHNHIFLLSRWCMNDSIHPIGGNIFTPTCLSPSILLTSVHWGKPLHVFGLTSEVSVVGARMSLTMGYHYGPSADLLVLVCVRREPLWPEAVFFSGLICPMDISRTLTGRKSFHFPLGPKF